jgi:hypothetical protein
MKLTEKDIELIDAYIKRGLTDEGRRAFESRLQDEHFKEELEYRKDLRVATNTVVRENRKLMLQQEESRITFKEDNSHQSKLGRRWKWLLIIIILLTIIYFIIKGLGDKPVDTQVLFAENYKPYPNVVNPIQMSPDNKKVDPFQLYEQGQYEMAITTFKSLSDSTESTQFYKGLSYLFTDDMSSAKSIMMEITQNDSHRYHQAAEWYLTGILLNTSKKEDALLLLVEMSSEDQHPYRIKATNLLKSF